MLLRIRLPMRTPCSPHKVTNQMLRGFRPLSAYLRMPDTVGIYSNGSAECATHRSKSCEMLAACESHPIHFSCYVIARILNIALSSSALAESLVIASTPPLKLFQHHFYVQTLAINMLKDYLNFRYLFHDFV